MKNCDSCWHAMIGEVDSIRFAEDCFLVKKGPSELQVDKYLRLTDDGKDHDCEWWKDAGRLNGHE